MSSLGIALAIHAALIGAALLGNSATLPPARSDSMDAIMVELAPEPKAPPSSPTEVPLGPAQVQTQELVRSEPAPTPRPQLPIENAPLETPDVLDPDQDEQVDKHAATDPVDVAQTLAPPSVDADSGEAFAAQQTVAGTSGQAVATWQGALLGHLERYRRYPRQAERQGQQGVSYVRFTVDRQGNVADPRIARTSGNGLLDEEALATVRRASPVPPPPADMEDASIEVVVPVEFFISY